MGVLTQVHAGCLAIFEVIQRFLFLSYSPDHVKSQVALSNFIWLSEEKQRNLRKIMVSANSKIRETALFLDRSKQHVLFVAYTRYWG